MIGSRLAAPWHAAGPFVPSEAIGAQPVLGRHRRPALQHVHVGRAGQRQQVASAAATKTKVIQAIAAQNSGPSRRVRRTGVTATSSPMLSSSVAMTDPGIEDA